MTILSKEGLRALYALTKRNVLLFMRDKAAVFFSLLAQIIIILLYTLFLQKLQLDGIKANLGELANLLDDNDVSNLINGWLLSGLVGSATITIALNSLFVMVRDKEKKIDYDYISSPVNGPIVLISYFLGAVVTTYLLSGIILTCGLVAFLFMDNLYLTFLDIICLYLILLLAVMSSVIILMLIVSFFKKTSALTSFSGVISAAIGFLIGAYIPMGQFNNTVQTFGSLIPGSHVTCIFRNYFMEGPLLNINDKLNGLDGGAFAEAIRNNFAFDLTFFNQTIGINYMYVYIVLTTVLALGINLLLYRYASKRSN